MPILLLLLYYSWFNENGSLDVRPFNVHYIPIPEYIFIKGTVFMKPGVFQTKHAAKIIAYILLLLYYFYALFINSYFNSVNIATIPRFIAGKNRIFGIIHCSSLQPPHKYMTQKTCIHKLHTYNVINNIICILYNAE